MIVIWRVANAIIDRQFAKLGIHIIDMVVEHLPLAFEVGDARADDLFVIKDAVLVYIHGRDEHCQPDPNQGQHQYGWENHLKGGAHGRAQPVNQIFASQSPQMSQTTLLHFSLWL